MFTCNITFTIFPSRGEGNLYPTEWGGNDTDFRGQVRKGDRAFCLAHWKTHLWGLQLPCMLSNSLQGCHAVRKPKIIHVERHMEWLLGDYMKMPSHPSCSVPFLSLPLPPVCYLALVPIWLQSLERLSQNHTPKSF